MIGTEKQIEYSENLRETAIVAIDSAMEMNAEYFEDYPGIENHYNDVKSAIVNFTGNAGTMIDVCKNRLYDVEISRLIDGSKNMRLVFKNLRDNK